MSATEAQKRATKKWNERNREHRNYLNARSVARGFIRNKAKIDDLLELQTLIQNKLSEKTENIETE